MADLAQKMGATLSASRPLIDAGWLPAAHQVGQSGRTVRPKVYLAMGISGAVQHQMGMRNAETIIAVNTDPNAPIFGIAHYGAVADLSDVSEALAACFDRGDGRIDTTEQLIQDGRTREVLWNSRPGLRSSGTRSLSRPSSSSSTGSLACSPNIGSGAARGG